MVACRQAPVAAFARQFHSATRSLHDGTAVAHHQTDTGWNLEVVQRNRIRGFFAVRHYNDEELSSFESATGTARARHPFYFLSVRNLRDSSKPIPTVQHCLSGSILAVLHRDCVPGYHGAVPVCAHGPPAA